MQTFKRLLVVFFLSASLATTAHATLIVDTGPGPAEDAGFQNVGLSWIQSLAGQFSTTQTWLIESIQGWMSPDEGASTATVAIYSDIGSVPGSALYAAEFLSVGQPHANWQGTSALDWLLPTGTYWAVFEVRPGQTFDGYMPSPSVSPIPSAYSLSLNNYSWLPGDFSIGVRIQASEANVPVPATLSLLGFALLMLGRRLWVLK